MAIPKLQDVVRATFQVDGGSSCLYIVDGTGSIHRLELVQHMIRSNSTAKRRFGRLYFDDTLIDVRSEDEATLMNFLQTAPLRSGYEVDVKEVLTFVHSDEYVQLARDTSDDRCQDDE